MKTLRIYLLIMVSLMIIQPAVIAQETCEVRVPSLAGTYEGDCKKGKANGIGKAKGTDEYQGEFKNGYPHGKGVYRWKTGDSYDGSWVNGKREGNGGMTYKRNGKDSVVTGFWKNDLYVGKTEKPYIIHHRTNHFTQIEIEKKKSGLNNTITIELGSTSGGTNSLSRGEIPKPVITNIQIKTGSYLQSQEMSQGDRISSKTLVNVTFPFRAVYYVGDQETEIEILEPGNWLLKLRLNE